MGWIRKGVLDVVFDLMRERGSVNPVKDLAALTKIPAGNLSSMNHGKRPMTVGQAERISDAVEGIIPMDLGVPAEEGDTHVRAILVRLQALEDGLAEERDLRVQDLAAVTARLAVLEAGLEQAGPGEAPPGTGEGDN